jgi:NADH-quinone oxidoreductase subunit H
VGFFEFLIILVNNVVLMLLLTIIIASLTLIERKFLALVQRRVGPQFVGYKGRLQYIADALKLFIKGIVIPSESNKFWFITIPSIVAAVCYSFWINAVWGPSISLFEVEFNIIYISLFSVMFGICVMLTGFFSKNKYAMLAAVRTGIGMLNLEIFLGLMLLNIVFVGESFSFLPLVVLQEINWLVGYFFIIIGLITITFLLETNRAPFDLAEAESELVAGYQTEYGGFLFGLYYLGEYMHLFFFSLAVSIMFLGGWELPMFVFNFFLSYYDNDFLNIFKVLEN